jgi:hypothetical protein
MSRRISKCRRYGRTIFNSAIPPYDPFSETGRWRTNNLRYMLRRNNGKLKSDCPIKTIARRGKFTAMHAVRVYYESTTSLFCMSSEDEINIGNDKEERN